MYLIKNLLLAATLAMAAATAHANDYVLDPAHTYPNFSIEHFGMSTMYGRFGKTEGKLSIDMDAKTGAVEVVIDAASVDTGHAKRDEHLRSPDFLNVVEFPEISFKSTNVTFTGEDTATVDGDLTMLGVSKPVTLDVTKLVCGKHPFDGSPRCGFHAETTIKRSDWGMNYGIPAAIGDEMVLMIGAEAAPEG